jgi:pimeloyl-ACP methyl ester carboxylesterase
MRWAAAALFASALFEARLLPGCVAPPAILECGVVEADLTCFPPGTERVDLALPSGEILRGMYAPSEPGAPLVLQFAESSGSVVSRTFPYCRLFWDGVDAGFAVLMFDYRGVGESDGERSTAHLGDDALAMWKAALARVGGDPSRVVVRATSIGVLAAASLVEHGIEPAGWRLIAPIRSHTVVENFGCHVYNPFLVRLAAPLFRPVVDFELEERIPRMRGPLSFVVPRDDFLLPSDERTRVHRTVDEAGGAWEDSDQGHEFTALGAHHFLSTDRSFLRALFAHWPDEAGAHRRGPRGIGARDRREGPRRCEMVRALR